MKITKMMIVVCCLQQQVAYPHEDRPGRQWLDNRQSAVCELYLSWIPLFRPKISTIELVVVNQFGISVLHKCIIHWKLFVKCILVGFPCGAFQPPNFYNGPSLSEWLLVHKLMWRLKVCPECLMLLSTHHPTIPSLFGSPTSEKPNKTPCHPIQHYELKLRGLCSGFRDIKWFFAFSKHWAEEKLKDARHMYNLARRAERDLESVTLHCDTVTL